MLQRLIEWSARHATVVAVMAIGALVAVGSMLPRLPVDVFPELNAPTVVIMAEAGGLAAEDVERAVVFPIEVAVQGLPDLRRLRSASSTSLGIVWVEFEWGTDLHRARQLVAERLSATVDDLPAGVHAEIAPITSLTGEVMLVSLASPDGSVPGLELRSMAEHDLRPRLLSVGGVAQVVPIGGELAQYQVRVAPDRLRALGVTMEEVVKAARDAQATASAGVLADVDRMELPIRQFARVSSVDDLRAVVVAQRGDAMIRLGDVADVVVAAAPLRGTASEDGHAAVVVSVQKSPGVNTLELTARLDAELDAFEASLPAGVVLNRGAFRAARFIERSVANVRKVLIEAAIVVAVIVVLFLGHWRATLITLTALPLSLAAAVAALWALGLSLNVMTLGGLAVAIGELVDDAIIDVENVVKRLRERARRTPEEREPLVHAVIAASNEVRGSVVFATLIICLVFAPLLLLGGLEGRFFQPLGIAYIVSILASLVVALTVTPALCVLLLRADVDRASHEPALVGSIKRAYGPWLESVIARRRLVLWSAGMLAVASLALASTFGRSFLPSFREGTWNVFLMSPPGTSLAESDRLARAIELQLTGIEGVATVTRRTGRAERDEHAEPVSNSELEVTLAPDADADAVRRAILEVTEAIPGMTTMLGQPIEHRLSHVLGGTPAALTVSIEGEDLGVLRTLATRVARELEGIEGTSEVAAGREVLVTSLPIRYRSQDLAIAGLTPGDAARQVGWSLGGERVGTVIDGRRRLDIVVRLDEPDRSTIDDVRGLVLQDRLGRPIQLSEVAGIDAERTSNLIAREGGRRRAIVTCNIEPGADLAGIVARARLRVDPIVMAEGCTVRFGGQFEAQQSAQRTLWLAGAASMGVMLWLLWWSTGRLAYALVVMLNVPLALIGGVAAVVLIEGWSWRDGSITLQVPNLSIASFVGFITLFGIAVRNGLLLVNQVGALESQGVPQPEAIRRGAMERIVPILMTALTAALGLLPLVIAWGQPGSELLAPLAAVVLGGLASSTALNLFVVPAACSLLPPRVHTPAASAAHTLP